MGSSLYARLRDAELGRRWPGELVSGQDLPVCLRCQMVHKHRPGGILRREGQRQERGRQSQCQECPTSPSFSFFPFLNSPQNSLAQSWLEGGCLGSNDSGPVAGASGGNPWPFPRVCTYIALCYSTGLVCVRTCCDPVPPMRQKSRLCLGVCARGQMWVPRLQIP